MANITFYVANRYASDTTWLVKYVGAQTSTNFEMLDSSGMLREYDVGVNFNYYGGFYYSGTQTASYSFSSDGTLVGSATGLDVDVYTRNNLLSVGTSGYDYYQYEIRGNDKILGSAGDDKILGSKGNDTIDGGSGIDVLSFKGFGASVTVNLSTGSAVHYYGTSSLVNIEDAEGSSYGDSLTGNASNNSFQGFGGNDTITGGSGTDTASYLDATYEVSANLSTGYVTGGSGSDTLSSIERIVGSRFNDVLIGSSANETFIGGFGNDSINGGGGIDTVEYSGVGAGVDVNLTSGTASGGAGVDTLVGIENVNGSIFSDSITGNSSANVLRGGNGNDILVGSSGADTLYGDAGNDLLRGGTGNDILYGGSGNDLFRLDAALSTLNVQNLDQIKDFNPTYDTIQLENSIFTKFGATTTGVISPAYFKANTTGLAGDSNDSIIYETDTGKLFYDTNGNAAGGSVQVALLGINLALTSADFVLV